MITRFITWLKECRDLLDVTTLRRLAYYDPLTRAYNRHYLAKVNPLAFRSLVFIDIHNLRDINKTHGHLAGDAHIVFCCNLLRGSLLEGDLLFRYGGDEFLILTNRATFPTSDYYAVGHSIPSSPIAVAVGAADLQMRHAKARMPVYTLSPA